MSHSPNRFDLRERSTRTGRLILPPVNVRRACNCCQRKVAAGWTMPNGHTLCGSCEDVVSRARFYIENTTNASLKGFCSHMKRLNDVPLEDDVVKYLALFFGSM